MKLTQFLKGPDEEGQVSNVKFKKCQYQNFNVNVKISIFVNVNVKMSKAIIFCILIFACININICTKFLTHIAGVAHLNLNLKYRFAKFYTKQSILRMRESLSQPNYACITLCQPLAVMSLTCVNSTYICLILLMLVQVI